MRCLDVLLSPKRYARISLMAQGQFAFGIDESFVQLSNYNEWHVQKLTCIIFFSTVMVVCDTV
jgi:hypothetical protein